MPLAATTPPRLITLICFTALSTLSLNMFLPSLSTMADEFEVDYGLMTLAVAGYLGVTAVLMLVVGPLSDRFGRRPVMLWALAVFTIASLVCAMTESIGAFLAARVFQGAMISGWAISSAVVRDTTPPKEAASKLGYIAMAMAVAPMLGPLAGGLLDELFGWRATFLTLTGLGVLCFVLAWIDLGETNNNRSDTMAAQIRRYPGLLRAREFWGYAVCMAFSVGAFYSFLAGAPLVAVGMLGLSPAELGFYMGTVTAGFSFGAFLSGRYAARFRLTTMMIAGRLVSLVGLSSALLLFLLGHGDVLILFGGTLFVGIGNGLTLPSSNAGSLSVRPKLAGSASGLAGAVTLGIGSLLSTLSGTAVAGSPDPMVLLSILIACVVIGLLAALEVRRLDRRAMAVA
ncbi:MAG: multidrug effflux MFS transporter [Alphaproteobacteria bacterium]|nr:multidrug effflux MFS transporter [Alphaproteobacteria bacterium]